MIAALRGALADKGLSDAVIDVNGVGYRVYFSLLSLAKLPEQGAQVSVRIRTVVREDALDLYGFLTQREEELFQLLTSVSHVGPKVALGVLSGLEVDELVGAIAKGEVARLTKIHGVGRKTAERLVLELKDKMKLLGPESGAAKGVSKPAPGAKADLVSALINLGYKDAQAQSAADAVLDAHGDDGPFELLFREALKALRG
ncbi:MAG: Holliday junction branch migration protein RuvA [Myxococcaceae bacterium]